MDIDEDYIGHALSGIGDMESDNEDPGDDLEEELELDMVGLSSFDLVDDLGDVHDDEFFSEFPDFSCHLQQGGPSSTQTVHVGGVDFEQVRTPGSTDLLVFNHIMSQQKQPSTSYYDSMFASPMLASNPTQGTRIGALDSAMYLRAVRVPLVLHDRTLNLRRNRLRAARMARSDDCMLNLVLRKARELILYRPEDSAVGQAMIQVAGGLSAEPDILKVLADSMACKAVSTCVKRVGDYFKFAKWIIDNGTGRPMAPTEQDVYSYVTFLEQSGCGATSGESFLKSVGFMHGCFTFLEADVRILLSSRSKGASRKMLQHKRPLKQAALFSTDMVWFMEDALVTKLSGFWAYFCGFVLLGIYSCARFSDLARASAVEHQVHEGHSLVEVQTLHWKGSTTHERKLKPLRMMAIGTALHQYSWAEKWMRVRKQLQLDSPQHDWLLPAFDEERGQWMERPMTASEGVWYLRELLMKLGYSQFRVMQYSTHSMKRTMLHWIAVSMLFTMDERRILGHHFDSNLQSPLTYSSEEMVILQAKVQQLVRAIKSGQLDPNLRGAELLAARDKGETSYVEHEPSSGMSSDEAFCATSCAPR